MLDKNGKRVREHKYHAEGKALEGNLLRPHLETIEPQAHARIRTLVGPTEEPSRHYESQHAEPFSIEGIVSFGAAHTQAAGHEEPEEKDKGKTAAFKTLSTAAVEDFNLLNVITCDRVVAQVSTDHPRYEGEGEIPKATFLGAQFHNLRIGGFPVEVELDLDLLNPKEKSHEHPYNTDKSFLNWMTERLAFFRKMRKEANLEWEEPDPKEIAGYYKRPKDKPDKEDAVITYYSLVTGIKGKFPGTSRGNVLDIPHFGKVLLGVVRVVHSDYEGETPRTTLIELTMIDARMGCLATGDVSCAVAKTNGGSGAPGTS